MQQTAIKRQFLAKLDRPFIIAALIIPIVHLGLGYIDLSMTFVGGASAIWPSFGVFLAGMLLVGYRVWPTKLFPITPCNSRCDRTNRSRVYLRRFTKDPQLDVG
ncbi:sensor protein [Nostoc linckia NIES-25]|nr:sensor protein [Nostoc linckia NIES-25]